MTRARSWVATLVLPWGQRRFLWGVREERTESLVDNGNKQGKQVEIRTYN